MPSKTQHLAGLDILSHAARILDNCSNRFLYLEPLLSRNLKVVERLRETGKRQGRNSGEVAIAWTLHHPAVTAAIIGFRSAKQAAGVIRAADFRLSPAEIAEIESAIPEFTVQ